jgi:DNA-directed RNA polymerase specialized sigma24 family protein
MDYHLSKMDYNRLLTEFRDGTISREDFAELYIALGDSIRLYLIINGVPMDDKAQDHIQDCWLRLLRKLKFWDAERSASPLNWIFLVLRRKGRGRKPSICYMENPPAIPEEYEESPPWGRDVESYINGYLGTLTEEQRETVDQLIEGKSIVEIARQAGKGRKRYDTLVRAAKDKLKEYCRKDN